MYEHRVAQEYRVTFFKKGDEKDECLGFIILDDSGTSRDFTLLAKAFRLAPSNYLYADKTITERV
jgi:hypothetical protein